MVTIRYGFSDAENRSFIKATGHAGNDMLCNSVTSILECLAANLLCIKGTKTERKDQSGNYTLKWISERPISNLAAAFALTGIIALAKEYPDMIRVIDPDQKEGSEC